MSWKRARRVPVPSESAYVCQNGRRTFAGASVIRVKREECIVEKFKYFSETNIPTNMHARIVACLGSKALQAI